MLSATIVSASARSAGVNRPRRLSVSKARMYRITVKKSGRGGMLSS